MSFIFVAPHVILTSFIQVRTAFISLLVLTGLSTQAKAQFLSLEALIHLRGQDVETVNATLSGKGWRFNDAQAETSGQYGTATWSYGQRLYSERAESFFKLYTADGYFNKVSYQTSNRQHYELLKGRIVANKMTKLSSQAENGYISTTYMGANYFVMTSIGTDELTERPVYTVTLGKKVSYVPPSTVNEEYAAEESVDEASSTYQPSDVAEEIEETDAAFSSLADNTDTYAPRLQDVVAEDEIAQTGTLYARPWNTARKLAVVEAGTPVKIISKLLDEHHAYYFVYVNNRYGYVKFDLMRSNQDSL